MNTLTWFLYLTSFPEKIGALTALGFLLAFVGAFAIGIGTTIQMDRPNDQELKVSSNLRFTGKFLITIWILLLSVWFVVPPKETLYYMAASEMGEKVVTDPQAIEIMGDLKTIIKGYASEFEIKKE